jgi:hypothetical protein
MSLVRFAGTTILVGCCVLLTACGGSHTAALQTSPQPSTSVTPGSASVAGSDVSGKILPGSTLIRSIRSTGRASVRERLQSGRLGVRGIRMAGRAGGAGAWKHHRRAPSCSAFRRTPVQLRRGHGSVAFPRRSHLGGTAAPGLDGERRAHERSPPRPQGRGEDRVIAPCAQRPRDVGHD